MGEIYLITNKLNNKKYVGQTKYTAKERFKQHTYEAACNTSNSALHKAITKYGEHNFELRILLKNVPEYDLDRLEKLWINKLDTLSAKGYNLTEGGGGVRGYKHTDATIRKISEALKGVPLHHGDKIREGFIRNNSYVKRSNNPNWKNNISKGRLGKYKGEQNGFFGKHHTEEFKINQSKKISKPVLMYSLEGELIRRFDNAYKARDYLLSVGITKNKSCESPISKACRGAERKTAYGYIWKFENEGVETNCTAEDELPLEVRNTLIKGEEIVHSI